MFIIILYLTNKIDKKEYTLLVIILVIMELITWTINKYIIEPKIEREYKEKQEELNSKLRKQNEKFVKALEKTKEISKDIENK